MRSNKLIVIFLIKFFGTYALLFLLYSFYLKQAQLTGEIFSCSAITTVVANQTVFLLNTFGFDAETIQNTNELSLRLIVDGKYLARIIEGCNAISIIILFISFIVAFSSKFKPTFLYIVFGSTIIYVVNIFRIAFITVCYARFPKYQVFLHDIVFPLIIYGITFLLWFVWVRKFSKSKKDE